METETTEDAANWFVRHGLLNLLSHTTQIYLSIIGTTHIRLNLLTLVINQENVSQTCKQASLLKKKPQFVFLDDGGFCQVDQS